MMEQDVERRDIEARLEQISVDAPPIQLRPKAPQMYGDMVAVLQQVLALSTNGDTPARRELVDAVRALVEKIVISPLSQERGAHRHHTARPSGGVLGDDPTRPELGWVRL
ncbi:MAG: hypothetical protein ACYDD1_15345 [Caulobacteraceae bacterium]